MAELVDILLESRDLLHIDDPRSWHRSVLRSRADPRIAVEPVDQDVVAQDQDVEQGDAELFEGKVVSVDSSVYRVTKVLGDTDYVDIKMRVASSISSLHLSDTTVQISSSGQQNMFAWVILSPCKYRVLESMKG